MVKVYTEGHNYFYEVLDILSNFFDKDNIEFVDSKVPAEGRSLFVHTAFSVLKRRVVLKCAIVDGNQLIEEVSEFPEASGDELEKRKQYKRMLKHNLLKAMEKYTNKKLPWGILTGIRPVKVVHRLLDDGYSQNYIENHLVDFYRLSREKALLSLDIADRERKYILPYDDRKVSIYISVPFCPTRCSYCSFPSHEMGKWGKLADEYLECLAREMEEVYRELRKRDYVYQTVYVGGGTPTSLNHRQLIFLLDRINRYFVTSDTRELTVEAGRPDTVDREKLCILKDMGATRISINPQSMNAVTLEKIGRKHTPEDILRAYELARETGHKNINMDIIIGLPGENVDMVTKTLEVIKGIKPEGLTVHTLAIKRASRLNEEISEIYWVNEDEVAAMVETAALYAKGMGMHPYYLYKQRYMVGNHENVGYSLPGFECLYNMQIMEEKQTIVGIGAGAVSKLVFLEEDRLERVENIKNVEYYISRFEQVLGKKISQLQTL